MAWLYVFWHYRPPTYYDRKEGGRKAEKEYAVFVVAGCQGGWRNSGFLFSCLVIVCYDFDFAWIIYLFFVVILFQSASRLKLRPKLEYFSWVVSCLFSEQHRSCAILVDSVFNMCRLFRQRKIEEEIAAKMAEEQEAKVIFFEPQDWHEHQRAANRQH